MRHASPPPGRTGDRSDAAVIASGGALVTGAGRGLGFEIARGSGDARPCRARHGRRWRSGDRCGCSARRRGLGARRSTCATPRPAAPPPARPPSAPAGSPSGSTTPASCTRAWPGSTTTPSAPRCSTSTSPAPSTARSPRSTLMRPADSGHVLNVVSLAGLAAAPGETLYSATKHACLAFSVGTLYDLRRSGTQGRPRQRALPRRHLDADAARQARRPRRRALVLRHACSTPRRSPPAPSSCSTVLARSPRSPAGAAPWCAASPPPRASASCCCRS